MDRAEQAWVDYEYREHPKGLYHTCFVDGYRQAEKDLALTWEDVNLIDSILIDMQDEGVEKFGGLRQYYEETLKRFNEQRKK